jgi:hypothetical protein
VLGHRGFSGEGQVGKLNLAGNHGGRPLSRLTAILAALSYTTSWDTIGSTTAAVVICRPFAALDRGSTTTAVVICCLFAALDLGSTTATGVIICQQNACRAIVPFRRACSTFQSHVWRGFQPFREGLFYLFFGLILHLTLKCSAALRLFYLSKPRLARLSAFSRGLFYLFSGFILHLTLKCSASPALFYLSKPRLARLSAFSRGPVLPIFRVHSSLNA